MSARLSVSLQKGLRSTAQTARGFLLQDIEECKEAVRGLESVWSRCADSRAIAYGLFVLLYIIPNLVLAHRKLMWDDEFFTLYLSKTKNWGELWRALSTGADQHPPSFYYLTHLIFELAGTTHITLRLAPLLCFGLFCVCLCEIARRVVGRKWALVALLLPLTTPALSYATEGRGYGIELGFVTFSLLMWILAAEGRKRGWTVPALAVGLCLSVASHYYAVFSLFPLVSGQLVKTKLRRSIDVPVYCAFLAALIPLVLFAPIILKAEVYSAYFWAVPSWPDLLEWYQLAMWDPNQYPGYMSLLFVAASGLVFVLRIPASQDSREAASPLSTPVVVALAASAMLPVVGMIVAQFITHAFSERYFVAALPGTCIVALWGLRRIMRNDTSGPIFISILCVLLFAVEWRQLSNRQFRELQGLRSVATLLRRTGNAPIVMSDIGTFHKFSFYARRDLVNRLVYPSDPHLSVRHLGFDTIDRGLLALVPWFPLKIMWWHEWWRTHPFSLVYGYVGELQGREWAWHSYELDSLGKVQVLDRDPSFLLFGVTRTNVPEDDHTANDPPGKPMLYDQLPANGLPLCKVYMPTETCPVVDPDLR